MDEALRALANEYGYDAIQKRLRVLAAEDLETTRCKVVQLESFLEESVVQTVPVVQPAPAPAPAPTPEIKTVVVSARAAEPKQESALEVNALEPARVIKKVVKKSQIRAAPVPSPEPIATLTPTPAPTPEPLQDTLKVSDEVKPKFRDPKEVKAWQKAEEEKKKQELRSRGIKTKDVLTRDNLAKWLSEGYTYARIAREEGGCTEQLVSQISRGYGLSSVKGR
jgi:hypothetical protein